MERFFEVMELFFEVMELFFKVMELFFKLMDLFLKPMELFFKPMEPFFGPVSPFRTTRCQHLNPLNPFLTVLQLVAHPPPRAYNRGAVKKNRVLVWLAVLLGYVIAPRWGLA